MCNILPDFVVSVRGHAFVKISRIEGRNHSRHAWKVEPKGCRASTGRMRGAHLARSNQGFAVAPPKKT